MIISSCALHFYQTVPQYVYDDCVFAAAQAQTSGWRYRDEHEESREESQGVLWARILEKKRNGTTWYYILDIDIFQDYGVRKRIEHCYKSIQHISKTISAVHPKTYSSRFQDFVFQIFLPEEDHPSHSY